MLLVWYPKCSTCQKAKKWLDARGIPVETRDIKLENPTAEELRAWQGQSGLPLQRFFNTSGQLYRSQGLKDKLPAMGEEGHRWDAGQAPHPGGRGPYPGGLPGGPVGGAPGGLMAQGSPPSPPVVRRALYCWKISTVERMRCRCSSVRPVTSTVTAPALPRPSRVSVETPRILETFTRRS